jgi:hypothetical protein
MVKCPKCGTYFPSGKCPACGSEPEVAPNELKKKFQKHTLLMVLGLLGVFGATRFYRELDGDRVIWVTLGIFFFPVIWHVISSARKRLQEDADRLQMVYRYAGFAILALAGVVGLNGALDWTPATPVKTSILGKTISHGRRSTTYRLVVASWREGRMEERLEVSQTTFRGTFVGEPVVIELHRGVFGLPWYGRISPENNN